jgi:hypothetical protein
MGQLKQSQFSDYCTSKEMQYQFRAVNQHLDKIKRVCCLYKKKKNPRRVL